MVKEVSVRFVWFSAEAAISSLRSIVSVRDAVLQTAIVQTTSDRLSACLSLCHILAKRDMALHKKCLATVSFMNVGHTSLKGVSDPNLYFAHVSTDLGEIPYTVYPFNGDE